MASIIALPAIVKIRIVPSLINSAGTRATRLRKQRAGPQCRGQSRSTSSHRLKRVRVPAGVDRFLVSNADAVSAEQTHLWFPHALFPIVIERQHEVAMRASRDVIMVFLGLHRVLQSTSRGGIRTRDLRVMIPTSNHCSSRQQVRHFVRMPQTSHRLSRSCLARSAVV